MKIAAAIALAVAALAAQARPLTVTNLGTLTGSNSWGYKVNGGWQAVGASDMFTSQAQGFRWVTGNGIASLGANTRAGHNISNTGIIVGEGIGPFFSTSAFKWQNNILTTLPSLNPSILPNCAAFGVNNAGDAVGDCWVANGYAGGMNSFGVLWKSGGGVTQLPLTHAAEINMWGVVAGYNGTMAATWNTQTNTYTALGTLGGGLSKGYAINNMGRVVGYSETTSGQWHAFIWVPNQGMTNLGAETQFGSIQSYDWDISESNLVVGEFSSVNGPRAFVWNSGVMTDLNTLIAPNSGWVLEKAYGIGGSGIVVGKGKFNGQDRAWMINLNEGQPNIKTIAIQGSPTYVTPR